MDKDDWSFMFDFDLREQVRNEKLIISYRTKHTGEDGKIYSCTIKMTKKLANALNRRITVKNNSGRKYWEKLDYINDGVNYISADDMQKIRRILDFELKVDTRRLGISHLTVLYVI